MRDRLQFADYPESFDGFPIALVTAGLLALAAMGICYEAASMGLGTCIIGTMNQEKLHRAFGIPEEHPVRLIITVGYPANEGAPRKKARKELDEIVTYNQW